MFERILLPLDGSALAEQALPYAVALARCQGGTIHVLRVAPILVPLDVEASAIAYQQVVEEERAAAQSYVDRMVARLQQEGISAEGQVKMGDPAGEILETARQINASAITMATHGRSGLGRLLFGSVADQVLRGASVPVLLIRATASRS
jgi:nucleotide-binding universal stress UspA family protein